MIHDEIVAPALEYYDKIRELYRELFHKLDPTKFEQDITRHDMTHNKITFFDKKNNKLITTNYEIVGIYSNTHKMWCWAWGVPILNKNETYISKKILNYGLELEGSLYLKTELVTSRFQITDKIQLEIHIAIATYLTKKVI